ncbi:hypothetical protein [Parathalassolituus penaei]|uniref:Uncharacterized protein n=1 Tax=Parathalassolituus penaei TaxID=2997323 RepID=A0A9X3EBS8_9GAMM|nr:hypothetical protein [Parathalassolituus penaei]MCY0964683.1 hypothetical protein [Parathalassolituus penaei]
MKYRSCAILAAVVLSQLLTACDESNAEADAPAASATSTSAASTSATGEALVSTSKPLAQQIESLPNTAPVAGQCAGWQRDLATGSHQYEVEACLRQKALNDRAAAVADAMQMSNWIIRNSHTSDLKDVLVALIKYPAEGSLEKHLRDLSLLPNAPDEEDVSTSITAAEYLMEMGNVYWFDTETGSFPNQHDYLLTEIAALSDLPALRFTEIPPAEGQDDQPYRLQAVWEDKSWQRDAENLGDWYDVETVLSLLNQIALDLDASSRFVYLPTGDQTAAVWVVDQEKLAQLLTEGLLTDSGAMRSTLAGKNFEQAFREAATAE